MLIFPAVNLNTWRAVADGDKVSEKSNQVYLNVKVL